MHLTPAHEPCPDFVHPLKGPPMSCRSLLPVAAAAVLILLPVSLHGQAANSRCIAAIDLPDCTGIAGASAPSYVASGQPASPDSQFAASIGSILAQRRADKPVVWQAWSQATDDNARIAAQRAKANYNAMTAAIERLETDTVAWLQPALNRDLNLDFSLLRDVEARYEEENPDTGRRREALTRISFTPAAGGEGGTLRLDENGDISAGQRKAWSYQSSIRYEPASSLFYQTEATFPLSSGAFPGYEAVALVGDHAFSAKMPPSGRVDAKVAPGAVYPTMLGLVITAMPGELPSSFTVWIVNDQGEAVPAEIKVVAELTVQEPVGPAGGTCAGETGVNQPRRAVKLQIDAGSYSHERVVLADAPHLKVSDGLKCRVVR